MPVVQFLSNEQYKAKIQANTLAAMVKVWKTHLKGEFDLTVAQKFDFQRRCARLRLGMPVQPPILTVRRAEVEVAA